tara:strand:+ start:345 stop:938 length:594 start_codon:yes stop_codon:yes gene_type:complete
MKHLLINIFLFSLIFSQMPLKEFSDWNILQDDEIWVGYTQRDFPWCKSSIILPYSLNEILLIIENVDDYHKILDSVIYSTKDENDIAHIRINYPFPFTDREYIVKFNKIIDNKDIVYEFSTNSNLNTNLDENYVRLINAKGEWRLSPIDNNLIEVSYLWNGELRGDFPSWSLSKAWIKHANEVLGNLKTKLEENSVQ